MFLILGCITGTAIGYSSWWCRDKVAATTFTLIGVMNKCLTVLLNLVIWDQHAPPMGIASLFVCLIGGMLYQQAPMRIDPKSSAAAAGAAVAADAENVWNDSTETGSDPEIESESLLERPDGITLRTTTSSRGN